MENQILEKPQYLRLMPDFMLISKVSSFLWSSPTVMVPSMVTSVRVNGGIAEWHIRCSGAFCAAFSIWVGGIERRLGREYIDTILQVAKKVRSKQMGFVWIQGGTQTTFEEVVGINMNYPTVCICCRLHSSSEFRRGETVESFLGTKGKPPSGVLFLTPPGWESGHTTSLPGQRLWWVGPDTQILKEKFRCG